MKLVAQVNLPEVLANLEHEGDLHNVIAVAENELMRRAGREAGSAQAEWQMDHRNSSIEGLTKISVGLRDGDPEILDYLPTASNLFSGEWAGSPNWEDKVSEILNRPYNEDNSDYDDGELFETYSMAFDEAAHDAVEANVNDVLTEMLAQHAEACEWCGTMIFTDPRDNLIYAVYVNAPPRPHTCDRTR